MSLTTLNPTNPGSMPSPARSGLYTSKPMSSNAEAPILPALSVSTEELRLDVDGRFPLGVVSGTLTSGLVERIHWIGNLTEDGKDAWKGRIAYRQGSLRGFDYVTFSIVATDDGVTITYMAPDLPDRVSSLEFKSPYYRQIDFEFDHVEGSEPVLEFQLDSHPNRPPTLVTETLRVQDVFERCGFDVTMTPGGPIPVSGAGEDQTWSMSELHDAMRVYWSRFADRPQWAMWMLFATNSTLGPTLGGIMFDDIGPFQRQGSAIFNDSRISLPFEGDDHPDEWVRRMKFWAACHEIGHALNLPHTWQAGQGLPWIESPNRPGSMSFMNYPNRGQEPNEFFERFEYRFDPEELLFMRHAPERFVQPGGAAWFDNHGFEQTATKKPPTYELVLRVHRDKPAFDFMEPVLAELKLTNRSGKPQMIDEKILSSGRITKIVKRQSEQAKLIRPYCHRCFNPNAIDMLPGESFYDSVFLSSAVGGWLIAEPGRYVVQVVLHLEDEDIVSNPLNIHVLPPDGKDAQRLAQDYFSDDVGRVLYFDGSRHLGEANDVLRNVVDQFPEGAAPSMHARVALAQPLLKHFMVLQEDPNPYVKEFQARGAELEEASAMLEPALVDGASVSIHTLGHIDFKLYIDAAWKAFRNDRREDARKVVQSGLAALSKCQVLESVLEDCKAKLREVE